MTDERASTAITPGERAMGAAMALTRDIEAAAVVIAHANAVGSGAAHPAIEARLAAISDAVIPGFASLEPVERATIAGVLTSILRQATDLVDHPGRTPGWRFEEGVVLEATGRASMSVAGVLAAVAPSLEGLAERLDAGGGFCDVGTGVGWLAIAAARHWPNATITGIDLFAPALARAERNVIDAGLTGRVHLRDGDVSDLDGEEFDLIWLPGPFLAEHVVDPALEASGRCLRPGGWLAFGIYGGPRDPLAQQLADLRTVRSGGHPWTAPEVAERLAQRGYDRVGEVERTWSAPVRLVVGRRP